jgi:hypothetical protein
MNSKPVCGNTGMKPVPTPGFGLLGVPGTVDVGDGDGDGVVEPDGDGEGDGDGVVEPDGEGDGDGLVVSVGVAVGLGVGLEVVTDVVHVVVAPPGDMGPPDVMQVLEVKSSVFVIVQVFGARPTITTPLESQSPLNVAVYPA